MLREKAGYTGTSARKSRIKYLDRQAVPNVGIQKCEISIQKPIDTSCASNKGRYDYRLQDKERHWSDMGTMFRLARSDRST